MSQQQQKLQAVIDRLVTDAIRRILPGVMNEVLLRTIAGSGALSLSEGRAAVPRQVRKKPGPKPKMKRRLVQEREERKAAVRQAKPVQRRARQVDLNELLGETAAAGSEFYEDPRARHVQAIREQDEYQASIERDEESNDPMAALNPALRAMAEGIEVPDDDDGGMWQPGEHDATSIVPDLPPIKDVGRTAAALGIDFSQMAKTIAKTSPAVKPNAEDVRNRAIFEQRRLKMMRENLNGGKPVE